MTEPQVDQIFIKVDGADINSKYLDGLIDLEINTTLGLPSMFIMRFHDETLELVDGSIFPLGSAIQIDIGPEPNTSGTIMKGEITALEPEFDEDLTASLTVRGYDKGYRLNRATQIMTYVEVTDSDIVSKIAGRNGLSAVMDATTEVRKHVYQDNQTDWVFLHALARRNGYEVFVDDTKLYFRKPAGSKGELALEWGVDLVSFHPNLSISQQVSKVVVKGWNPETKEAISGEATSSSLSPEIGIGGWGGSTAESAVSSANHTEVRYPVQSAADAGNVAKAILDQINSGFIQADGIAWGNVDLVAGKKVNLTKIGEKFSGKYIVTSATHIYSHTLYQVHFTVEGAKHQQLADFIEEAPSFNRSLSEYWGGVVPAIVTNNNNTEQHWGHVKVKFPWMDDSQESTWARLASVGASKDKGFIWMPDVNDEVLVSFEHGDFNRPYVIGSLWNGTDTVPEAIGTVVQGGAVVTRMFKTGNQGTPGHIIRLTDKSGEEKIEILSKDNAVTLTLDAANKKLIINSTGNVEITATDDLNLTGKNVNITANSNVTMKATSNVNIEATSNATLKGMGVTVEATGSLTLKGALGELSASGILTVKGSLVKIN